MKKNYLILWLLTALLIPWCQSLATGSFIIAPNRLVIFDNYDDTSVWFHEGSNPSALRPYLRLGNMHTNTAGWQCLECRNGNPASMGRVIPPLDSANLYSSMANTTDARIISPVFQKGVGTIYFEAVNNVNPVNISCEAATNMIDRITGWETNILAETEIPGVLEYNWVVISNLTLNATTSTGFIRYYQTLNWRYPAKLRWCRQNIVDSAAYDSNFAVFDNFRITEPPADVKLRAADQPFDPPYPEIGAPVTISCYMDNISTNRPITATTVYVNYRWRYLDQALDSWSQVPLVRINAGDADGRNQLFSGQIPAQTEVGDLEYYFSADFTGYWYNAPDFTQLGFVYPQEKLSPRYLRGGTPELQGREFYTRLRRYSSPYSQLYVITEPNHELFPMELINHNEWQALIPVGGAGLTNLTWNFRGEGYYDSTTQTIATNHVYWSQEFQEAPGNLPYGGRCITTNSTGRCQVLVDSTGYLKITLNTATLDYMACRAEFQNFNEWPAPADLFSESSGQDPKAKLINTFDGWNATVTDLKKEFFVGYPSTTNVYWSDPQVTMASWVAGRAAYTEDRFEADIDNTPTGLVGVQNVALRLKGGDYGLGLGFIYNINDSRTDGIENFSFKARLGQPYDTRYIIYHHNFIRENYAVTVDTTMNSGVAAGRPSVSVLAYYTSPGDFYEYRITQIPQVGGLGTDGWQQHELYKWKNGVATQLKTTQRTSVRLSNRLAVQLRLYNSGSSTILRCRYGTTEITALNHTDSTQPHTFGTYGMLSADGAVEFSNIRVQPTAANAATTGTEAIELSYNNLPQFNENIKYFSIPYQRYMADSSSSRYGIYSKLPQQKLGVYLHESSRETTDPPSAPGTLAWKLHQEITLDSFGYVNFNLPLHNWRADYIMLQVGEGGLDVIVDELAVTSWRSVEISDSGLGGQTDWIASEAWVVASQTPGLSEGRLPGEFNISAMGPLTDIHLGTRFADTTDFWATNTTVLYKGMIFLNGSGGNNVFAEKFSGNVQLIVDDEEIIFTTNSVTSATGTLQRAEGWYPIELRLGRGSSYIESGGPYDGGINGFGVAYSRNNGTTWNKLHDTGTGDFLRANVSRVQLDHERADPSRDQSVRSPLLERGMGLLEFDYQVLRGPAKLTIQYALRTASGLWHDVETIEYNNSAPMTDALHFSAYLGNYDAGYIRVLNERSGIYTNALVEVSNATAWDEPFVADNSWMVYNARITETDLQRVSLNETKACFLNNSETAETSPVQDQDRPHIKSPKLYRGVGALSFMARTYDPGQSATLYVMASTNGWNAPASEWFPVANIMVDTPRYEPYVLAFLDGDNYDAIRLATLIGDARVCVEDIVVSEPVFPSFEIMDVKVLTKDIDNTYIDTNNQPMEGYEFGIEARIGNMLLQPSNIIVWVSYYIGTNEWGVANWPTGETVTKPMYPVEPGSLIYRTDPNDDLPGLERDTIVQYQVWANYHGGIPLEQYQITFVNPSQYYPLDLNQRFAGEGWSPYVIIYGLPVGAVWINELNVTEYVTNSSGAQVSGFWDNQYVEIAVPAGYDLAGWKLEFVQNDRSVKTITIPSNLPEQVAATNGYAFFVVAGTQATLPKVDYGYPSFHVNFFQNSLPGGVRLLRPAGMYEHTIAYDWNNSYGYRYQGDTWASEDPEGKLVYVGREYNGGSLGVVTNQGALLTDWHFPGYWTPGLPNENQVVPQAAALLPGFSNVLINAVMNNTRATQNGYRTADLIFKMSQGNSTNITYVLDDWYRLQSLKVNEVEQLTGGELADMVHVLTLDDVQTNTVINAKIGLRSDIALLNLPVEVLQWLYTFPDAPLATSYYSNGKELTMQELFWLDADPTVSHTLTGSVEDIEKDTLPPPYVHVQLSLDGNNVTHLQGDSSFKLKVKRELTDPFWTMIGQWTFTPDSFDTNHISRIFLPSSVYAVHGFSDEDLHFTWTIEYEDPRFMVWELTNSPAEATGW